MQDFLHQQYESPWNIFEHLWSLLEVGLYIYGYNTGAITPFCVAGFWRGLNHPSERGIFLTWRWTQINIEKKLKPPTGALSLPSKRIYIYIRWIYPPPSISGKWRFSWGFTKDGIIMKKVTVSARGGTSNIIYTFVTNHWNVILSSYCLVNLSFLFFGNQRTSG